MEDWPAGTFYFSVNVSVCTISVDIFMMNCCREACVSCWLVVIAPTRDELEAHIDTVPVYVRVVLARDVPPTSQRVFEIYR